MDSAESENLGSTGAAACLNCGKKPGRPKFCDRSCAAMYNNKRSPKRRLQGTCSRCGQPCSASRPHCEGCKPLVAAEIKERRRRESENVQQWTCLDGRLTEAPLPRIHVGFKTVFNNGTYGRPWTLHDPCGPMLDHLMGIIFAKPAYIHPTDVRRYATWIDAFRQFVTARPGWKPRPKSLPVHKLPIAEIGYALQRWIVSLTNHDNPLMASFALDAADFIAKHVFGKVVFRHRSATDWELSAFVSNEQRDGRDAEEYVHDKQIKKLITECLRGGSATVVKGVVPVDGIIVGGGKVASVMPSTSFYFQIDRCHLSESWYDYPQPWEDVYIAGQSQEYDIAEGFAFPGILLLRNGHPKIEWRQEGHLGEWLTNDLHAVADRGVKTYIPARWLSHWVEFRGFDGPCAEHKIGHWLTS